MGTSTSSLTLRSTATEGMTQACSRAVRTHILSHITVYHMGRPNPMKQKLTVSIDAELLTVVKRYARAGGVSLSSLVEQSLRDMAGENRPSFSSRWRGKFRAAGHEEDPRYDALAKKYLQ